MISQNQSCFKPGDSCINQLLAITHKIYKSFEACLDVKAVFRYLKSIQQGLAPVFSFQVEAEQCLLETLTDLLKDQKQRVVLNGQNSSWANVETGVPQGSFLSPLLFLSYINDLPDNLSLNAKLFADKALPSPVVHDITTFSCNFNYDLNSNGMGFSIENEL